GPVRLGQFRGVVGDDADHAHVVEVTHHHIGTHRVVDHRRDRAQRGQRQEVNERLQALGDHDAHRFTGFDAVGVIPLRVVVAHVHQVVETVAAQFDLAAVVAVVCEHERNGPVGVVLGGELQKVAGTKPRLGHETLPYFERGDGCGVAHG